MPKFNLTVDTENEDFKVSRDGKEYDANSVSVSVFKHPWEDDKTICMASWSEATENGRYESHHIEFIKKSEEVTSAKYFTSGSISETLYNHAEMVKAQSMLQEVLGGKMHDKKKKKMEEDDDKNKPEGE